MKTESRKKINLLKHFPKIWWVHYTGLLSLMDVFLKGTPSNCFTKICTSCSIMVLGATWKNVEVFGTMELLLRTVQQNSTKWNSWFFKDRSYLKVERIQSILFFVEQMLAFGIKSETMKRAWQARFELSTLSAITLSSLWAYAQTLP